MQVIPTMEPRPNSTNINAFEDAMVDILSTIPSAQNEDWGFQGLIQSVEIYALSTNVAWRNWPNPGPTRRGTDINPTANGAQLNADEARAAQAVWEAESDQFNNEQGVRRAVIDTMNRAIPKAYRRRVGADAPGIGHTNYKISDEPRDILAQLRNIYGRATPLEK
jgi:hypothetical protein